MNWNQLPSLLTLTIYMRASLIDERVQCNCSLYIRAMFPIFCTQEKELHTISKNVSNFLWKAVSNSQEGEFWRILVSYLSLDGRFLLVHKMLIVSSWPVFLVEKPTFVLLSLGPWTKIKHYAFKGEKLKKKKKLLFKFPTFRIQIYNCVWRQQLHA